MFAAVQGEMTAATVAGRQLMLIRVTEDALAGSPVAVPAADDNEAMIPGAPLVLLIHPDDWRALAEPFWKLLREIDASRLANGETDEPELSEEMPGPDGCRFYGIPVESA